MLKQIIENYPEESFLILNNLNEAIIGVEEGSMRLIYSKFKCIEIFKSEGMSEEDALEHYYFNVEGGYLGERTPIFCNDYI